MKKFALALATVAPLALAGTANAKDMSGRFGAGGQGDTGGNAGLSLKYWLSDLGFQGILDFAMVGESADNAGDDATSLGLALRVLYNIARANDTNLYAGAGVSLGLIDAEKTQADVILGIEHFFTDHFSVGAHVGLHIDLGDRFVLDFGNVAGWGSSVHFYF